MGLLSVAAARRRAAWAVAGGTALGLAALTKLSALILIPAAALLLWSVAADARRRGRLLLAGGLPVVFLVTGWFAVFYSCYGCFLPGWIRPDAAMIEASELVRRAVSQPWHYYLTESTLVAPVVLVVLIGCVARWRQVWTVSLGVPFVWVSLVVVGLTVLGLRGQGMQLRFLTIASPGLYAMMAALLARADPRRPALAIAVLLAVLYGAIYSGYFLLNGIPDEIQPVPRYLWQVWRATQ
jgi:4-amino-4-deoxy-L-arabinose transferase-like glycosyltransferase